MASIRRSLSYHERSSQNGGSPLLVQSASLKLPSDGKRSSPPLPIFGVNVRNFLAGPLLQKYSRKYQSTWKRSLNRCLLFFFLGFLLGMARFGDVEDVGKRSFSVEIKQTTVNAQQDVVKSVVSRPENYALDKAELGAEKRLNAKEAIGFQPKKPLIVVTPTHNRALQAYFLNRLGQVLRLVQPPLLWIVVEMNSESLETAEILRNTGVMYRHLACITNLTSIKHREVHQRNTALEHMESHQMDGIVYFADDDNIYSVELFENMRETSRFGTWPVAMLAQSRNKAIFEGPICNGIQVIGWHTNERSKRPCRFHIDMSGFAFNSTILWDQKRWNRPTSGPIRQLDEAFQENLFVEQMVEDERQMEGIPSGCSKIMNWHLHLEAHDLVYPTGWLIQENLDVVLPID